VKWSEGPWFLILMSHLGTRRANGTPLSTSFYEISVVNQT
jgi:hypothetical protein